MPRKTPVYLTGEQRAEVVRRYEAGESRAACARAFNVSRCTAFETIRCYRAARGLPSLKRPVRKDLDEVSAERWREIYWGPELPSIGMVGDQFRCSGDTIRRRLFKAGIKLRSGSEQKSVDLRMGRVEWSGGSTLALHLKGYWAGRKMTAAHRAKIAASQRVPPVMAPCEWCGEILARTPYKARRFSYSVCIGKCRAASINHRRFRPDDPRPIIVDKLCDLLRDRPATLENAEAQGRKVGAREPELMAAMERMAAQAPALKRPFPRTQTTWRQAP